MKPDIYFWSELLSLEKLNELIPMLGTHEMGLNLAITPLRIQKVKSVVKKCENDGVELNFWPLLSKNKGYWINRWNINIQKEWFEFLLDNFPSVSTYLLDLENPINFKGLKGNIKKYKLKKIISDEEVKKKLDDLVKIVQDHGKKVISTSYGGIPLGINPRPSNADWYSYMVYTSLINRVANKETRENIIYYCANKIRTEHGADKAAIDLGLTYHGIINKELINFLGLLSMKELKAQISICKHVKLKRIHIFSIDNMSNNLDQWINVIEEAEPKRPPLLVSGKKGLMYRAYRKFLFHKELGKF